MQRHGKKVFCAWQQRCLGLLLCCAACKAEHRGTRMPGTARGMRRLEELISF